MLSNILSSEFEKIHHSQTMSILIQEEKIEKETRAEIIHRIKLSGLKHLYKPLAKFYGEGEALCCCLPCLQVTLISEKTEDKNDNFLQKYIRKFKGIFDLGLNPIATTKKDIDTQYTKYISEFQKGTFEFNNFSEVLLESDQKKKKTKYEETLFKITDESNEKEHIAQAVKNLADQIYSDNEKITLTDEEKYEILKFLEKEYERLLVKIKSHKEETSFEEAYQKDSQLHSTRVQSDASIESTETIEEKYQEIKVHQLLAIEREKAAIEEEKRKNKNQGFLAKTYYYLLWKMRISEQQETKFYKKEDQYNSKKRALEEKIKKIEMTQRELEAKDTWKRKAQREVFLTKVKLKMNEDFLKLFIQFYKNSKKIYYMTKFLIWTCPFKNEETPFNSFAESCCSCWWFNPKTTIEEQIENFYHFYHNKINETEESCFIDISLFKNKYSPLSSCEEEEIFSSPLTVSERLELSYELASLMHLLVE